MIKKFEEFIKENTEIPGIFDENKELLKQFFDFLLEANKRPKAKYHLAFDTNNSPVWNGDVEEKYKPIWIKYVNQLKQLSSIYLRTVEEVVDKDGNCIDPNFRNILIDLDEDDYIADWDEDKLTFEIPAEIFDEEGYDFITEKLLEITEEGYKPKNEYKDEDDSYLYDDSGELKEIFPEYYEEWEKEENTDGMTFSKWLGLKHPEVF